MKTSLWIANANLRYVRTWGCSAHQGQGQSVENKCKIGNATHCQRQRPVRYRRRSGCSSTEPLPLGGRVRLPGSSLTSQRCRTQHNYENSDEKSWDERRERRPKETENTKAKGQIWKRDAKCKEVPTTDHHGANRTVNIRSSIPRTPVCVRPNLWKH